VALLKRVVAVAVVYVSDDTGKEEEFGKFLVRVAEKREERKKREKRIERKEKELKK
jgi:hypothetical protein